jgi:hypothetical protein
LTGASGGPCSSPAMTSVARLMFRRHPVRPQTPADALSPPGRRRRAESRASTKGLRPHGVLVPSVFHGSRSVPARKHGEIARSRCQEPNTSQFMRDHLGRWVATLVARRRALPGHVVRPRGDLHADAARSARTRMRGTSGERAAPRGAPDARRVRRVRAPVRPAGVARGACQQGHAVVSWRAPRAIDAGDMWMMYGRP